MKVGILGSGDVATALAKGFLAAGYEVKLGSRVVNNPKLATFVRTIGGRASAGTFADAAAFGDLVVLATLGTATSDAIKLAGVENFAGKVVLDTTNPLETAAGGVPRLVGGLGTSAGEKHQTLLVNARVVKVFNTVGNALMYQPKLAGGPPDMFICGNDAQAKTTVRELLAKFGWNTIDVGGIDASHYLEAMCLVWVLSALKENTWMQAFKLLR